MDLLIETANSITKPRNVNVIYRIYVLEITNLITLNDLKKDLKFFGFPTYV